MNNEKQRIKWVEIFENRNINYKKHVNWVIK